MSQRSSRVPLPLCQRLRRRKSLVPATNLRRWLLLMETTKNVRWLSGPKVLTIASPLLFSYLSLSRPSRFLLLVFVLILYCPFLSYTLRFSPDPLSCPLLPLHLLYPPRLPLPSASLPHRSYPPLFSAIPHPSFMYVLVLFPFLPAQLFYFGFPILVNLHLILCRFLLFSTPPSLLFHLILPPFPPPFSS